MSNRALNWVPENTTCTCDRNLEWCVPKWLWCVFMAEFHSIYVTSKRAVSSYSFVGLTANNDLQHIATLGSWLMHWYNIFKPYTFTFGKFGCSHTHKTTGIMRFVVARNAAEFHGSVVAFLDGSQLHIKRQNWMPLDGIAAFSATKYYC